jgi:hypothetical protein
MDCDEEQMQCKGTSNLFDEGVRFFLVEVVCNSVKYARGAHFNRLSKKRVGSHANRGIN